MRFFNPTTAHFLAVAVVIMTAQVTCLPTYGLVRRHHHTTTVNNYRRSHGDDHGDVSAHDGYEAQLHGLEAALRHYEEYGDAKSLETYLKGFSTDDPSKGSNSGDHVSAPKDDGENDAKNGGQEQGQDCEQGDQSQSQQQPSKHSWSQWQQQQHQPKMVKKPKKTRPQPSQDYTQPKPEPQRSQPQTPPKSYNPAPPKNDGNSSPHTIDGYTCPKFDIPSSSPSTTSLYTSSAPFTGRATYYDTGLGACGITNSDSDPIVAISRDLFEQYNPSDANPNHNSLCGRKVEITWKGKTVRAFATDECPGCENTSLDMSPKVFESLDAKEKGVLDGIQWRFV
ncbi:uncharacterized protein UHOD_07881 [Ustilago sp. UG-2017b]|nr:uncharacterized protein UHOD_07881 [Ustilago sp. UG-2017b]